MDGWTNEQADGLTDRWMDIWTDGQTDGWMDGSMCFTLTKSDDRKGLTFVDR